MASFVRRSARMTESQTKAWERYQDRWLLDFPREARSTTIRDDAHANWGEIFGRQAPIIVEIGSGAGDSLVPMAAARPEINFVAFEVHQPMVASTLGRMARADVDNIRIILADAHTAVARLFDAATIQELWTFFADPWHKNKHHKRRLISRGFAEIVATKLADGGLWRLATDWAEYAQWQRNILDSHSLLRNIHNGWAPRFKARPITRFEQRGLDAGRAIHELTYQRIPR